MFENWIFFFSCHIIIIAYVKNDKYSENFKSIYPFLEVAEFFLIFKVVYVFEWPINMNIKNFFIFLLVVEILTNRNEAGDTNKKYKNNYYYLIF